MYKKIDIEKLAIENIVNEKIASFGKIFRKYPKVRMITIIITMIIILLFVSLLSLSSYFIKPLELIIDNVSPVIIYFQD